MKRKPIKIDWEELESAFQTKSEDLVYYLDLVTGQVVLEGEGEDLIESDEHVDEDLTAAAPRRNETTRLYIDPPGAEEESDWMEDFVDDGSNLKADVLALLKDALEEDDPLEAFREVLRHHPDERDRWFGYRGDRVHQVIEQWLEEHAVRSVDAPPWKG